MSVAFRYQGRSKKGPWTTVLVGEEIELDERVEYVLSFERPYPEAVRERLSDIGGDPIGPTTAILSFRNFVGRTSLAGVGIDVVSKKLGPGGVGYLLDEVSSLASGLVFGWATPTGLAATASRSDRPPVPYHVLQFLRRAMLDEEPSTGGTMQDWLSAVLRAPTRRFAQDYPVVSLDRVQHLDHRAISSVFSNLDRLAPIGPGTTLSKSPLAQALTFGPSARAHMPTHLAAPVGRLSLDTSENRFVRHVVEECLSLVYRFADHARIDAGLRRDCRRMAGILEQAAASPVLAEAGRLTSMTAPSQALMKSEGYRDLFSFWLAMGRHVSLPLEASETTRFLEGRNIATLYEYWVFAKVLQIVCEETAARPAGPPNLRTDELGTSLAVGLVAPMGGGLFVSYNPSFNRSGRGAYSTPLRPDVVLAIGEDLHAFDAKYRLDGIDAGDDDDDGARTYKRADLYKMHTYRDAIHGMRTAFVVYPGSEFVFFERSGIRRCDPAAVPSNADGVGAVPLRPSEVIPEASLRTLLRSLIPRPLKRP